MLLRLGPPPSSLSDSELASGEWRPVPRPPLWAVQLLSLPIGAISAMIVFTGWVIFTPRFTVSIGTGFQLVAALAVVLLAGTLLQISTYPGMGLSDESVLGFWPSRLTLYTAHMSKLTGSRLVATSTRPFVVLALIPLFVAAVLRSSSGWLVYGSCLAAAVYGTNAVLAIPAWRLSEKCVVAGRGFQSYWRLSE